MTGDKPYYFEGKMYSAGAYIIKLQERVALVEAENEVLRVRLKIQDSGHKLNTSLKSVIDAMKAEHDKQCDVDQQLNDALGRIISSRRNK